MMHLVLDNNSMYEMLFIFAGLAVTGVSLIGLALYLAVRAVLARIAKPTSRAYSEWRETMKCWGGKE